MTLETKSGKIALVNPVGDVELERAEVSPPVDKLHGKIIGFLFNGHYSAPVLFEAVKQRVTASFNFAEVVEKVKPCSAAASPAETIEDVAAKCDVAVVGVGA